jgi:hypothetical protein
MIKFNYFNKQLTQRKLIWYILIYYKLEKIMSNCVYCGSSSPAGVIVTRVHLKAMCMEFFSRILASIVVIL